MSRPSPPDPRRPTHPPRSPRSERPTHSATWDAQRRYGTRADRYEYDVPYARSFDRGATTTDVIDEFGDYEDYREYDAPDDRDTVEDYDGYEDYEDYDDYEAMDRRWVWVSGVAGAVLLVAVICTVVILGGGDSGSVSATVSPPAATTSKALPTSAAPPGLTPSARAPAPTRSLPPETVTTVAPTPTAAAPETIAPPAPSTITYRVTGRRAMLDLVTVIYTDAQGALQTDLNVALPWTKSVVLDPGVTLSSVTATSITGQLNCAITNASGGTVAAQANNSIITTCTS